MQSVFAGSKALLMLLLCLCMLVSCMPNPSEGEGNNKATGAPEEDTHEHGASEEVSVVSLTEDQMKAAGIQLGNIEMKQLTSTMKANGVLNVPNNNRANVTPLYGGVIRSLNVELGDYVRKGQVIATIVNPQFIQLQEDYLTVSSDLLLAEQELQRQQELHEGNAGMKRNLQTATAQLHSLRTRRSSLQQQIQLMGIDPVNMNASNMRPSLLVKSPINGVVSNVFAKLGSYVDVSAPVVEIVDNNMLHLDLQVFERDLSKLKVDQLIQFTITNNPTVAYTAKVLRIGASFENESKTIAIHSIVIGDKTGLIDGMNVTGSISVGDVNSPAVPNEAIVEAKGKFYILIQTDKQPEDDHSEEEHSGGEKGHEDENMGKHLNFEKIEIVKGVSNMGYTAIIPVVDLPKGAKVVVKGAFFINAKTLGGTAHSH